MSFYNPPNRNELFAPKGNMIQSPYLYLQAVGSDGKDDTIPGSHLRWSFARELAQSHLPKGPYAGPGDPFQSSIGFNKADDYVHVFRHRFEKPIRLVLDPRKDRPDKISYTGNSRTWLYTKSAGGDLPNRQLALRFEDIAQYDSLVSTLGDPMSNRDQIIQRYTGVLAIEPIGELSFAVTADIVGPNQKSNPDYCMYIETISTPDLLPDSERVVSARKSLCRKASTSTGSTGSTAAGINLGTIGGVTSVLPGRITIPSLTNPVINPITLDPRLTIDPRLTLDPRILEGLATGGLFKLPLEPERVVCENIQWVRIRCINGFPRFIAFELYEDFIIFSRQWEDVGRFYLEPKAGIAEQRLVQPNPGDMSKWPKFNDGSRIELANYMKRWTMSDGLEEAVVTYLDRSRIDLQAVATLASEYPGDESGMDISYLQMLQLVGLDYHAARMLGMGHIDGNTGGQGREGGWVYLAVYDTEKIITKPGKPNKKFFKRHMHMSLPTRNQDYRLPPPPRITKLHYGVTANEVTATPSLLTNSQGYSKYDNIRFINLDKADYPYPKPLGIFWDASGEFNMCDFTRPASYGVEYRKLGAATWEKHEISFDDDFQDPDGFFETVPLPDKPNPIFRHMEKKEGKHEYGLYGINWFSRVSTLSNTKPTNQTTFPTRNTLLPPFNFGVQYIQEENPLIFTSQDEQDALAIREAASPGADNSHTRVAFDWNHTNHAAYQNGEFVEFFFRDTPPKACAGAVKSHTAPSSGQTFTLRTKSYTMESQNGNTVVAPSIPIGEESLYLGSILSMSSGQFMIMGVAQSGVAGEGPVFTLERVNSPVATELDEDADGIADGVFVTENKWMPQASNQYANKHFMVMENLADDSQWNKLSKTVQLIKHSNHSETINHPDGSSENSKYAGVYKPANITHLGDGAYRVSFTTYVLPNHPDPDVSWYKGSARMQTTSGMIQGVEVWRVESDGVSKLEIYVFHPAFASEPLRTGVRNVNFHPGYRVYLKPEPLANFDRATLLPAAGQATKTTFMATRANDHLGGASFIRSVLTVPVPLMAREILEPEIPGLPAGPTYATRPDYYGKSTYTFDTRVNTSGGRKPYAMMFFRANDQLLINALYKGSRAADVAAALKERKDDGFFTQRWLDLVQFNYEGDGRFLDHNGYRLPNPNNNRTDTLFTGSAKPGSSLALRDAVKDAVHKAFIPITERPVVYGYINAGKQTSSAGPVVRDPQSGDLLVPGDPHFDANPMVRRYVQGGQTKIRFTDFTLDGASRNSYFYYAIELNVSGKRSAPSPIAGPIQLVNASPAEAPEILKVTSRSGNKVAGIVPAVIFELNNYPEPAGITEFDLFRTTEVARSFSVRSMTKVGTYSVGSPVVDEFQDLAYPPFGNSIFYRAVAQRSIKNESGGDELIPSQASNRVLSSVIDVENPLPPILNYAVGTVLAGPAILENVLLSWSKTTYQGTYHLFRMTAKGTWRKIYTTAEPVDNFLFPPAGNFTLYPDTASLLKEDNDGGEMYHRFRVEVVNASGLTNVIQEELTI